MRRSDSGAGPSRDQLVNSVSVLKEMQDMFRILQGETEALTRVYATKDTRKVVLTAHEAACKLLKIINGLILQTVDCLDEYAKCECIIGLGGEIDDR